MLCSSSVYRRREPGAIQRGGGFEVSRTAVHAAAAVPVSSFSFVGFRHRSVGGSSAARSPPSRLESEPYRGAAVSPGRISQPSGLAGRFRARRRRGTAEWTNGRRRRRTPSSATTTTTTTMFVEDRSRATTARRRRRRLRGRRRRRRVVVSARTAMISWTTTTSNAFFRGRPHDDCWRSSKVQSAVRQQIISTKVVWRQAASLPDSQWAG